MRAIVIDDSKAQRTIIRRILQQSGDWEIFEAGDGKEALERLEQTGPLDLALVDWNMPMMNGLEFIRAVRKDKSLYNMTMMMVTTESETAQVVRALAAGANEYLMKPFTAEGLLDKLCMLGFGPTQE